MSYSELARTTTRRLSGLRVGGLLVVIATIAAVLGHQFPASSSSTAKPPTDRLPSERHGALGNALQRTAWPAYGQAAVQIGQSHIQAGPNQHAAPIASVAKVMTAYLVLRDQPLHAGESGPTITLSDADVADTERRSRQRESVVPIVAGEQLTERQALQALLVPSANNIAAVLARWDAGTIARFVERMNATARSLGMTRTRYTDPSGYDDRTVSTAADQLRIVDEAMRLPVFANIVATANATLPVVGTVHNSNMLLGRYGFVGVKTGSDKAAGGCFAFRAIRLVHGKRTTITGVVLGQPGYDLIDAGLAAASAMVARISGDLVGPSSPQRLPAPGALLVRTPGREPVSVQTAHEEEPLDENTLAAGRLWRCHRCRGRRGLRRHPEQQRHQRRHDSRHGQHHHDRSHKHHQSHEQPDRP
jgi:serine-type D-Ala-D-Ala carboxypeptidase (penicillin-binding protein 5/6)